MNMRTNFQMLREVEEYLHKEIANSINVAPINVDILSIGNINNQYSYPLDIDECPVLDNNTTIADELITCERSISWRLSYFDPNKGTVIKGQKYRAKLNYSYTLNTVKEYESVTLILEEREKRTLLEELEELGRLNIESYKRDWFK